MSQNLDKKFRLVQNSHKLLSKSLGCGKENLQSAAPISSTGKSSLTSGVAQDEAEVAITPPHLPVTQI